MSADGYRGPQVCRFVGVTYRQLDYWCRTDLIQPSVAVAHGSGTQRRWSFDDCLHLAIVKALLDAGVELQRARRVLDEVRAHDDLTGAYLLLVGGHVGVYGSVPELVNALVRRAGVSVVLPVAGLVSQLEEAITGEHARLAARAVS